MINLSLEFRNLERNTTIVQMLKLLLEMEQTRNKEKYFIKVLCLSFSITESPALCWGGGRVGGGREA